MIDSFIIDEIYSTAEILKKMIGKDTQIILIGQSANYLKYCFSSDYDVKCIAISGRVFMDNKTLPNKDNLFKYYEYLKSKNITNKYTILIDHSHTGQSITSFSKILNRYFNYIDRNDMNCNSIGKHFDFINLISPLQINGWIRNADMKYIKTLGYIVIPHLVEIANENLPRTIHNYPHWKWNNYISEKDFKDIDDSFKTKFNNKKIISDVRFEYKITLNKYIYDNYDY